MKINIHCPDLLTHYKKKNYNLKKKDDTLFNIIIATSFIILVSMYLSYKYKQKKNNLTDNNNNLTDNNNNLTDNNNIELYIAILVIIFLIIYFYINN